MFGPKSLFGAVFLIAGSVFFIAGIWKSWEANQFAQSGIEAEGVVTEVRRYRSGSKGRGTWRPTVVFTARDGKSHWFVSRPGTLISTTYRVGERVPVIYQPSDPGAAMLDTTRGRYGWLAASLFASLFLALGVWLIRSERRELDFLKR